VEAEEVAVFEFQGRNAFRAIDHHWRENLFATAGAAVEVWSHERSEPVNTFTWGADSVLSVKFNPVRGKGRRDSSSAEECFEGQQLSRSVL
jgi:WD repeat and SOF domain-containing protein 1